MWNAAIMISHIRVSLHHLPSWSFFLLSMSTSIFLSIIETELNLIEKTGTPLLCWPIVKAICMYRSGVTLCRDNQVGIFHVQSELRYIFWCPATEPDAGAPKSMKSTYNIFSNVPISLLTDVSVLLLQASRYWTFFKRILNGFVYLADFEKINTSLSSFLLYFYFEKYEPWVMHSLWKKGHS